MTDQNPMPPRTTADSTAGGDYTARLQRLEAARWKRALNVQAPYRWNIERLRLGRTLDIGCGIGRNLANLNVQSVGVDHNADSVAAARARGFEAFTVEDFLASDHARAGSFESMLVAHVVEHMSADQAVRMIDSYLPYLVAGGRVCVVTPQEAGYRSDATHVEFVDQAGLAALAARLDLAIDRSYSFPFPRIAGKVFKYNEFVMVASRHQAGEGRSPGR